MRSSDWSSDVCSSDLLHSDLRISPEVNLRNQTAELSADALAKIDVLILDDRAWYDLAGSERQAVLSAARAGLGVLVLLGSEPDRSQRRHPPRLGFAAAAAALSRAGIGSAPLGERVWRSV